MVTHRNKISLFAFWETRRIVLWAKSRRTNHWYYLPLIVVAYLTFIYVPHKFPSVQSKPHGDRIADIQQAFGTKTYHPSCVASITVQWLQSAVERLADKHDHAGVAQDNSPRSEKAYTSCNFPCDTDASQRFLSLQLSSRNAHTTVETL